MTRKEYISLLAKLYYAANMSDADDNHQLTNLGMEAAKPDWMLGHECATHCQAYDKIVFDMGLGDVWGNILEEGPTDYLLKIAEESA